ncbi:MAG: transketolase [Proteobacteria bacterium]|nr:transketolase [Pseudomonadota bacterium]
MLSEVLPTPQKLHGNPNSDPLFVVPLKSTSGQPLKAVDPRSTRALVALMDMYAVLGGAACHYGGPAAFAELLSALHARMFEKAELEKKSWHEIFNFVNDAGHCENGLYALKANYGLAGLKLESLKEFRSIKSPLTGHGESHLFPEAVYLSNGPLGSAFPQAQGLALADRLLRNARVTVAAISDGACMEGEAKEAMAAIPGLARQNLMNPFVLMISDNNTKLSGRIDKESFSMEPTFKSLEALGWKVLKLEDGHHLQQCYEVISQAIESAKENPQVPVAIHAKTIKGIGTKKTAESSSGGHGFPLKSPGELPAFLAEIYDGEKYPEVFDQWIQELKDWEAKIKATKKSDSGEKIQVGISAAMVSACKKGLPVVSVTSDLPGSTGVAGFRKEFPQYSFDVGVAESNMVSTAAGLSKQGFIPVVDTFAQFGVTKGALPLTMASLSQAPMICVYSHTGFQDAADGASHQALSYFAMASSIPHVDVYFLSCSEEAEALMGQAIEKFAQDRRSGKVPHSSIFFLGRENFPKTFGAGKYSTEEPTFLGSTAPEVVLVGFGSSFQEVVLAGEALQSKGRKVAMVHPSRGNQLQALSKWKDLLKSSQGKIVLVEDHQRTSGAAQFLISELLLAGLSLKAKVLAVQGQFGQSAYTAQELYEKHGISRRDLLVAAAQL